MANTHGNAQCTNPLAEFGCRPLVVAFGNYSQARSAMFNSIR